jgi:hypothetical protein
MTAKKTKQSQSLKFTEPGGQARTKACRPDTFRYDG